MVAGWLWDVLVPPSCMVCRSEVMTAGPAARLLCGACWHRLDQATAVPLRVRVRSDETVWALGRYGGMLRRTIRALKYGGYFRLGGLLGHVLARGLADKLGREPALVTSVPLHWRRRWKRGYNQAAWIAAGAAAEWQLSYRRTLWKKRHVPSQVGRPRCQRRLLPAGTFQARPAMALRDKRIVLFDDVWTTGTTARACRRELLAAGAEQVVIAVAAYAGRIADKGAW